MNRGKRQKYWVQHSFPQIVTNSFNHRFIDFTFDLNGGDLCSKGHFKLALRVRLLPVNDFPLRYQIKVPNLASTGRV